MENFLELNNEQMLDIDGDCGGYNLTFAILTGLRAGRACHVKN